MLIIEILLWAVLALVVVDVIGTVLGLSLGFLVFFAPELFGRVVRPRINRFLSRFHK